MALEKDTSEATKPRPGTSVSEPPESSEPPPAEPFKPQAGAGAPLTPANTESSKAEQATAESAASARFAPTWLVPMYFAGLVFVYLGERVLSGLEQGGFIASGFGVALVLFATLARLSPRFRARGDRRQISNLMAFLSVGGLVALAIYFLTTDSGMKWLGLADAAIETQETVEGILTVVWVGLLTLVIVPMIFAQTALYPMRNAEHPESRRVSAAAASGLALALAAVYGSLFVFAGEGVDLKVDYSYFKTSTPSSSTRKIAESLDEGIRITAFFPQINEVRNEVEGYLKALASGNPRLKVSVKDRLLEPALAKELKVTQDGTLVLSQGDTHRTLQIGTELDDAKAKLRTLDRDFQEQLLKLARSRRTAYFTVGHGELNDAKAGGGRGRGSAKILEKILQKQNYTVRELGLTQGLANEVPDDAAIVLVLAPTEPFAPEETATLKRYAQGGGRLFMALDPDAIAQQTVSAELDQAAGEGPPQDASKPEKKAEAGSTESTTSQAEQSERDLNPAHASLIELAKIVGLEFHDRILANQKHHVQRAFNPSDRAMLYTSSFSSHASVSTLSRNAPRAAIVVSGAGSLKRAGEANGKVDFTVRSMPGTFADANRNFERDQNEASSVFQLAAAISRPIEAKQAGKGKQAADKTGSQASKAEDNELRAFVVSDGDAFADWVMQRVVGNQVLFVDAIRWLGGEESWAGEISSEEDVRIEHTKQEDLAWFYATIFGAPALVVGLGLTLSRRSKKRGENSKKRGEKQS